VLSGRTIWEEEPVEFEGLRFPREKVAHRVVRVAGRAAKTTWRYRIEPPARYRYEIEFENGSTTTFDNTYAPAEGGTLIIDRGGRVHSTGAVVRGDLGREALARPVGHRRSRLSEEDESVGRTERVHRGNVTVD